MVDTALEPFTQPNLQRCDERVELVLGAEVGHRQQNTERLRLELAVEVQAVLDLLGSAARLRLTEQRMYRVLPFLLDLPAPCADLEAWADGFSPCNPYLFP